MKGKNIRGKKSKEGLNMLVLIALAIFISTASLILLSAGAKADAPVKIQGCEQLDINTMQPHFDSSQISLSSQDLKTYDVNVQTAVTFTPGPGISFKYADFSPVPDGSSTYIHDITPQRVSDKKYTLNFNVKLGQNSNIDQIKNINLDNKMAAVVHYAKDGVDKCGYVYLNNLQLLFTGTLGQLPGSVSEFQKIISGKANALDYINTAFQIAQFGVAAKCTADKHQLQSMQQDFSKNCTDYADSMKNLLKQNDGNPHVTSGIKEECKTLGQDSTKTGPNTCYNNITQCFKDYISIQDQLGATNNICERIKCDNVVSLDSFSKDISGSTINDPLNINFCSSDWYASQGTNNEACKSQYLRNEQPKCPGINPINQSNSAAKATNPLDTHTWFCKDKTSQPITYVKKPAASIVNSIQCACLPAMASYVQFFQNAYGLYNECFGGNSQNNVSSCQSDMYKLVCDNVLNAFSCQGNDYSTFTGTGQVTFLANDKGDYIKVDQNTDPQFIANKIKQGYTREVVGQAHYDTSKLTNAICNNIFTDKQIDWPTVLAQTLGVYDTSTSPSVSSGVLCPTGTKLSSSCNCGLNPDPANANLCGAGNVCYIDNSNKFQCSGSDNTPQAAYNQNIPEYSNNGFNENNAQTGPPTCQNILSQHGDVGDVMGVYLPGKGLTYTNNCQVFSSLSNDVKYYKFQCNANVPQGFTAAPVSGVKCLDSPKMPVCTQLSGGVEIDYGPNNGGKKAYSDGCHINNNVVNDNKYHDITYQCSSDGTHYVATVDYNKQCVQNSQQST